MPVAAERALKRAAKKKFGSTTSPRARRYIYGAPVMQDYFERKRSRNSSTKKWRKRAGGGLEYAQ
jgi:hypothetical protein